ncbi:hypothetical protein J3Q64DRAFT_1832708 [Phycomyces blakesleeanus]|uniref:EF-hand domain-containing protein n=2 Tax=Phycomyces blakesleeanus TaxID=4837 RepID=A0A163DKY2_PHYB8|nr:hypothetical protein PHYBLDRAFT_146998 [Phycomyces blakesleeanus NRRL 1555(-)]OAD72020.1 hypothetical protein PHYBLDRAFT_146998 [Phycomyces blakesleeanus NRRL 1555(-)]|eukprot:XP_018290060.1 hypothetical protein PHYBLDRAFT_146998 [Phycomyces blakesleeanus NRRL 1555(-)]
MGQTKSKENRALAKKTHFSTKEISKFRHNLEEATLNQQSKKTSITEDVFKEVFNLLQNLPFIKVSLYTKTVKKCVPSVSSNDDVFLKRLYAAFDVDNNKSLGFGEFVDGLSIFMKGNPEEKLALSFKLYDVKHDGHLTKPELERVMLQLSHTFSDEDQTNEIHRMVTRMFEDLDVDGDGKLTYEEYKLSVMKEPLVVDFLERFLAEHNISNQPRMPSRPASLRSYHSTRSLTPMTHSRVPGSSSPPLTAVSPSRLSVRLSQAELLDYSHHQQQRMNSSGPTSPSSSATSGTPSHGRSNSPGNPNSPKSNHARLSRGTSMTSLDAALTSMEETFDWKNKTNGSQQL